MTKNYRKTPRNSSGFNSIKYDLNNFDGYRQKLTKPLKSPYFRLSGGY